MGKHSMDMSQESEKLNLSLEDGWYQFEVVNAVEQKSKKGNQMFVITLAKADNPQQGTEVYCIAEQGKRWFLKQLLRACNCPASEDGVYDWSEEDIIGQTVNGRVQNVDEEWIDRNGQTRTTRKSKVVEFK